MNKEEIISGMEEIMEISINHANPSEPYINDWHYIYLIAETIYNELKKENK